MDRSSWIVIASLTIAEIALSYEITLIYAAMPHFNALFGDPVKVGWLVTSFLLVSATAAAIGGKLGDMYGRRRVVLIALGCALAGSTISAMSTTLDGIIAGRAIQGFAACVLPLCIGLARQHLPPQRVAVGVGIILGAAAIGTGTGNLIGGYIIDNYPWQVMFIASAALAGLGMISVWFGVPRPSQPAGQQQSLDWVGGILFAPGLASLLYAFQLFRHAGLGSSLAWTCIGVGLMVLFVWYWYERRHPNPLIDVRMVFSGTIAKANLTMALVALSAFQVTLIATLLLQQPEGVGPGFGLSATLFGAIKMPGALLGIVAAPLAGHLAAKHGARKILMGTALCIFACFVLLALGYRSLWLVAVMVWGLALLGAATFTNVPNLIIENAPTERTSELVGFATVVRHLAGGVGTQLVLLLLATSTVAAPGSTKSYPTDTAYLLVFGTLAVITLLMWAVIRSTPHVAPEPLALRAKRPAHG
jgi:MFS family permease